MAVQGILPPKVNTSADVAVPSWKTVYQSVSKWLSVYVENSDRDRYDIVVNKIDEYFEPKKFAKTQNYKDVTKDRMLQLQLA